MALVFLFWFIFMNKSVWTTESCSSNNFNIFKLVNRKVICVNSSEHISTTTIKEEDGINHRLLYSEKDSHLLLVEFLMRNLSIVNIKLDEIDISLCSDNYVSRKSSIFPINRRIIPPSICQPMNIFFVTPLKIVLFKMLCNNIYYHIIVMDRINGESIETFIGFHFPIDDVVYIPLSQSIVYRSGNSVYIQNLTDFDNLLSDSKFTTFNEIGKDDCATSLYWQHEIRMLKTMDDDNKIEKPIENGDVIRSSDIMALVALILSALAAVGMSCGVIGSRLHAVSDYINILHTKRDRIQIPTADIEMI